MPVLRSDIPDGGAAMMRRMQMTSAHALGMMVIHFRCGERVGRPRQESDGQEHE